MKALRKAIQNPKLASGLDFRRRCYGVLSIDIGNRGERPEKTFKKRLRSKQAQRNINPWIMWSEAVSELSVSPETAMVAAADTNKISDIVSMFRELLVKATI